MWIGWDRSGKRDWGSWRGRGHGNLHRAVLFIITTSGSECSRNMKHKKMISAYNSLLHHVEIARVFWADIC